MRHSQSLVFFWVRLRRGYGYRYPPTTMRLAKLLFLTALTAATFAQTAATSKEVEVVYPDAHALYLDIHQNPELSSHETQAAAKLAGRMRSLGYDVTEHVGGTGVVAILKNGTGPTVMLRTELDALLWKKRPAFLTPAKSTLKMTPGATFQ